MVYEILKWRLRNGSVEHATLNVSCVNTGVDAGDAGTLHNAGECHGTLNVRDGISGSTEI